MSDQSQFILERYRRAASLAPPKLAAQRPSQAADSYWVDEDTFFFLTDKWSHRLQRAIATPAVADAAAGCVREVMSLESLQQVICASSSGTESPELLSAAEFDMPDRTTLVVSTATESISIDLRQHSCVRAPKVPGDPALYSPDGRFACITRRHNVVLIDRATGLERPLTRDGVEHHAYAQRSETAGCALMDRVRSRPIGLWSSDSQWFLTHRIDERHVPETGLLQSSPLDAGRPRIHRFKYPLPGDAVPAATYWAFHIASGRSIAFPGYEIPCAGASPFDCRRVWFSDQQTAWWISLDRYSRRAELICADLANGTARVVLTETVSSGYLDLHPTGIGSPNVRTLSASKEVIWYSERDGWGHVYLYDTVTGGLKNRITHGEWQVRDLVHVDERHRRLILLACGVDHTKDPARRCLCAVGLDGTGFEVLIAHEGDVFLPPTEPTGLSQDRPHRSCSLPSGMAENNSTCVLHLSNTVEGNHSLILDLDSRRSFEIGSRLPRPGDPGVRAFSCLAADRQTLLHGLMFLPSDFRDSQVYPLVDYVYPGPHVAHQPQSYAAVRGAPAMALAELGFVTIMLDTRGTPFGSRDFHQCGYGSFLEPQLADHAAVVRELCTKCSFIQASQIGIIGQSAGGAAAVRALCDYGDVFHVAVAACGSHDANQVMCAWSDKYRGADEWYEKPNGQVAHRLQGKLFLICGELDENVLSSQTLSLADALIAAGRDFELLVVPNTGHGVLLENGYAQVRAWNFLLRHLQGREPPKHFDLRFSPQEIAAFGRSFSHEYR